MRRLVSGQFELNVPAKKAIWFFTPEGEKAWVPGWNPVYPGSEPSETSGTVFTTDVGGVDTIWLIQTIDRGGCTAAYSRVTPVIMQARYESAALTVPRVGVLSLSHTT